MCAGRGESRTVLSRFQTMNDPKKPQNDYRGYKKTQIRFHTLVSPLKLSQAFEGLALKIFMFKHALEALLLSSDRSFSEQFTIRVRRCRAGLAVLYAGFSFTGLRSRGAGLRRRSSLRLAVTAFSL